MTKSAEGQERLVERVKSWLVESARRPGGAEWNRTITELSQDLAPFIQQAVEQAQAETLAAAIEKVECKHCALGNLLIKGLHKYYGDGGLGGGDVYYDCPKQAIRNLQPSSDALKKLLRGVAERVRDAEANRLCVFCRGTNAERFLQDGHWFHYECAAPTPCEADDFLCALDLDRIVEEALK